MWSCAPGVERPGTDSRGRVPESRGGCDIVKHPRAKFEDASQAEQIAYMAYIARLKSFNPRLEPQEFYYWVEEYRSVKQVEAEEDQTPVMVERYPARNYDLSQHPDAEHDRERKRKDSKG